MKTRTPFGQAWWCGCWIAILASTAAALPPAEPSVPAPRVSIRVRQKVELPGPPLSPDGRFELRVNGLAAQLMERATGKPFGPPLLHSQRRPDTEITTWAFSAGSRLLAVGTGDVRGKRFGDSAGEVRVWEVATGRLVASMTDARADLGFVNKLAFAEEDRLLLVDCEEISGK